MPYTLQTPQTKEEFLAKYAYALDPQGRFIPGKANLEYDDMNASDLYDYLMGSSPTYDADGNVVGTTEPQAEINADWIEDPRAKGWIAQHPAGAAIIGTILGGVGANALGLLGSGSGLSAAGGFGELGASGSLGAGGGFGAGGASGAWGGATGAAGTAAGTGASSLGNYTLGSSLGSTAGTAAGDYTLGSALGSGATGLGGAGAGAGATAGNYTLGSALGSNVAGLGGAGAAAGGLSGSAGSLWDTATGFLKDNPTLAKLGGAALGALAGQDTTTSSSRDPWAPAQPYLKENLARNAAMQDYYAKNPFSTEQKTAYQGLLNTLQNNQANAPVMQGIANSFMGSNRGLLGGVPQFTQGATAPVIDWSKYANIGMRG